jgi:hypothetical protein
VQCNRWVSTFQATFYPADLSARSGICPAPSGFLENIEMRGNILNKSTPKTQSLVRSEDNIKMDLTERVLKMSTGFIWLRIGTSGRQLSTLETIVGIHKG